ncbi:tRNA nucleotidyltransferase/poly(A) polymerase family protein [Occallatibacter riparius]|uniref:CCA tRNA nucleotidyltransferase n=1 Tax=Occallatibacter riparius TaxID=1002689 RepID=A0A9J7BNV8_9BACT|nr:CCA tRNA nucleotidyltransferase [Occallatibacter riparius]UWZ83434.1 CCA tRNA nucleotidyltransferase [Occallatibacter riparius]
MPDYIYLLENRLSADQQVALRLLRDAAREAEMILFLTGDAVRDLTSGHAVRDLEVAVYGNALKLKKPLEKLGAKVWGEDDASRTLYLCFPGTVRVDVVSTHSVEYKKPGQATHHWASIQEDLRRRDFTVNAMAISLNDGSYGLLMDPLNGVADIEARALRLVSNYGFLDEPALLIRATRYKTRLGWELDPRTQTRYENAKGEDVIASLSATERSRELEQIAHEDDGLKVLQAHEAEGWMKVLFPAWTPAKADAEKLHALHDLSVELLMQGVHADISAAQIQLLTAKMNPKDLAALKKSLLRPGFVEEWNNLDAIAAGFQKQLLAKENQQPSLAYKLFTTYDPEAVLWLGFTSKDKAVKERYNDFLKVWPEAKQKIPYALMLEMRIRAELPNFNEIVHQVFLQLIDGKLTTPEEMKAFLEPYSPPAPPPQVTVKRARGRKAEKIKETFEEDEEEASDEEGDEDLDDMGGDDEEIEIPAADLEGEADEEESGEDEPEPEDENDDEEDEPKPKRGKQGAAKSPTVPPKAAAKAAPVKHAEPAHKPAAKVTVPAPAKTAAHPPAKHAPAKAPATAAPAAKHAPAKHAPAKAPAKPAAPAKKAAHAPAKHAPVKKAALKPHSKPAAHKSVPKAAAKPAKAPASKAKAAKPKPHAAAKVPPKKNGAKAGKKR